MDVREGTARLEEGIRSIPDFPEPGIVFRDITPLLADGTLLRAAAAALSEPFEADGVAFVAGMEARGFILGALVAARLGVGFIPLRKPGKLPHTVHRVTYELEYGKAELEMHRDAFAAGAAVLLVDDLIATGGTARASCDLIERAGGAIAGCAFLIELDELGGRERLGTRRIHSVVHL